MDYFLGVSETRIHLSKSDLTDTEIEHLVTYRVLSIGQKERVKAYIQGILDESEL